MFSFLLIAGAATFFLLVIGNAEGCNPNNILVEDCAKPESISGMVAEIRTVDDIQNKKYFLTDYQKKAFRKSEYIYFLRFKNTIKMDRLYFDSFYITSAKPPSLKDMQGKKIMVEYRRRCLKNLFYSAGIEGRRYRDTNKERGLLFINKLPVLKIEKIEIIN